MLGFIRKTRYSRVTRLYHSALFDFYVFAMMR